MHLTFESVHELREFLDFAYETGRLVAAGREVPAPTTKDNNEGFCQGVGTEVSAEESIANREAQDAKNAAFIAANVAENAAVAKRKRRTKAEIAADETSERAKNVEPFGDEPGNTPDAPAVDGNPFEQVGSENVQAILNAPDQKSAIAAGIAATSSGTTDELPARDNAAAMDAITHLNRCREFIASQGMPKYNESFTVAGLQPNVMAYSDADRAHHAAALDHLTPKA
jgi:uncharacterized protein YciI